jgi:hypothetical protein
MCGPLIVPLVQLGITAVSAAAAYEGARKNASAQADAVNKSAISTQMDIQRQADQQTEAAMQQMNEHARAAARDSALFSTITGEYGGGNTADRGAAVQGIQQDERLASLARNSDMASQELATASMANKDNANARLASIQQPSALGTALQIGGAYAKYRVDTSAR